MRNYNHPYTPYDIQTQLMDAIYETLSSECKVGLFESPTGTGKTLSIICSSMTWLRDWKRANQAQTRGNASSCSSELENSDSEPDWVNEQHAKAVASRTNHKAIEYEKHLQNLQTSAEKLPPDHKTRSTKKPRVDAEHAFVPDDYYSDSEVALVEGQNSRLAAEIRQLTSRMADENSSSDLPPSCPHPIFFTSRTHSQLSQFALQLRLTSFDTSLAEIPERTKFLPLGSRKHLCINTKVVKLASLTAINDACVDLQKKESRCEYFPADRDCSNLVRQFVDHSFEEIHDIEDLASLGKQLHTCPYYSVRSGMPIAEIVALPYQTLLMATAREAMNLNIDGAVVVIDESHNLIDTITSLNSVSISLSELSLVVKTLKVYLGKFALRLNSGNRINLLKLIKLCQAVEKFLASNPSFKLGDFVDPLDIFQGNTADMINVHKLDKFLSKSKIAYKIESYMEAQDEASHVKSSSNPILFRIAQFLKCLTNRSREGRFIWSTDNNSIAIKYILLDPSIIFEDIVSRAKCVLLCGGTMEPMEDYVRYLFPKLPASKVNTFTCPHLIPPENLMVFPVLAMNTVQFEFSYDKRNQPSMISQLGNFLKGLLPQIPGGVVVFFPSYKYLHHVLDNWTKSGLMHQLESCKAIFQEPASSLDVDKILSQYTAAVKGTPNGACLLSVVGGKMSEGINFADDLARAVVVVGLPFPNAFSAEMIAKRKFIIDSCVQKGESVSQAGQSARQYYENICMRAVNQSVGRSIRHSKDYACIYLVDERYNRQHIQGKLSNWVQERVQTSEVSADDVFASTTRFFARTRP